MAVEKSFRPVSFDDYQGQEKAKKALKIYIKSAKMREDTLDHTIIYGGSGLGKTTLANIIANEMGGRFRVYAAPSIKKVSDVIDILLSIEKGDILFLDECHRLNAKCEEQLFVAMEQFTVEAIIDDMPQKIELPHFTLIGATTSHGMLSEPFRNRFGISVELQPYSDNHMTNLVIKSFEAMKMKIDNEAAKMIAVRGRGVPRIINGFVRRVRDFAIALGSETVNKEVVETTFEILDIDKNGLTAQDRRYINTLKSFGQHKAVGIDLICAAMNDDKATVENAVESYLIQKGFVIRTSRGRKLTQKGIEL